MASVAFSSTLQKIYATYLTGGEQTGADAIRDFVGAEHVVFTQMHRRKTHWRACSNIGSSQRADLDAITHDPMLLQSIDQVASGQVALQSTFVDTTTLRCSMIYQHHIRPLAGGLSALVLWRDQHGCSAVHLCRSLEKGNDFQADDVRRMEALAPHIAQSEQIHRQNLAMTETLSILGAALDAAPLGVVVLDGAGKSIFANAEAVALFEGRNGLSIEGRAVHCLAPRPAEQLARAIAAVLSLVPEIEGKTTSTATLAQLNILVPRGETRLPLTISVAPAPFLPNGPLHEPNARIVLLLRDPERSQDIAVSELIRLYAFTPREAQLATRLARGETIARAAVNLNLTEGTARQYLKRVFDKMGVRRQSELVRALHSSGRL